MHFSNRILNFFPFLIFQESQSYIINIVNMTKLKAQRQFRPEPYFPEFFKSRAPKLNPAPIKLFFIVEYDK